MTRVTADEVKEIMENCTVDDLIVDSFIVAANQVVDYVFATDTAVGEGLLKEIERWFTAHMLAVSIHRTARDEKIGDATIRYTGEWGEGLRSTPYGQMVITLDVSGKMATTGKRAVTMYAVKSFE